MVIIMINKSNYHKLKRYLKVQSKVQIEDLIRTLELNEDETSLLRSWYNGDTVVKTCMEHYICEDTYTNHLKKIFSKIYNYFNYQNIVF
jgi:hypothetical protein